MYFVRIISSILLQLSCLQADTFRIYQVGNSHTWDLRPSNILRRLYIDQDHSLVNGWHIQCGGSLAEILNDPAKHCIDFSPYGNWQTAFTDYKWDAVAFQPFPKGQTANAELASLIEFVERLENASPENQQAKLYIYATWPAFPLFDDIAPATRFYELWGNPFEGPTSSFKSCREYFIWKIKKSRDLIPQEQHEIDIIPVGEVMAAMDRLLEKRPIGTLNGAHRVYRDRLHMNNVGKYTAALTFYVATTGFDPRNSTIPSGYGPGTHARDFQITPEMRKFIQHTVWHTVSAHVYEPGNLPIDLQIKMSETETEISWKTFYGYSSSLFQSIDLENWTKEYQHAGDGTRAHRRISTSGKPQNFFTLKLSN